MDLQHITLLLLVDFHLNPPLDLELQIYNDLLINPLPILYNNPLYKL